jgi:hypothetical protein
VLDVDAVERSNERAVDRIHDLSCGPFGLEIDLGEALARFFARDFGIEQCA